MADQPVEETCDPAPHSSQPESPKQEFNGSGRKNEDYNDTACSQFSREKNPESSELVSHSVPDGVGTNAESTTLLNPPMVVNKEDVLRLALGDISNKRKRGKGEVSSSKKRKTGREIYKDLLKKSELPMDKIILERIEEQEDFLQGMKEAKQQCVVSSPKRKLGNGKIKVKRKFSNVSLQSYPTVGDYKVFLLSSPC